MRRAEKCLLKKVKMENPNGKRPLGIPRQRWFDTTNRDMAKINSTFNMNMASNTEQLKGAYANGSSKGPSGPFHFTNKK